MPKINKNIQGHYRENIIASGSTHSPPSKSFHLHKIQSVATSILTGHNQSVWKQRTRSNRCNIRLESLYLALKELQSVLSHWRQLNDLNDLTEKNQDEQKALKHLKAAFDNDLAFIDSFLQDLTTFQSRLLEHFLQPLKIAFPVCLPTEILLKIWQMCQPQTVSPVNFIDRKEARKFLLLIKTTVLSAYNLAILGQTVGSVPFKQLIILCHQNLQKIHGLQIPQPYCLQTSAASHSSELPEQQQQTAVIARLRGQNEAGGQFQSMSAFPNLSP